MKLLSSLSTVLEEEQIKSLEKFLLSQADLRTVVWEDVLEDVIKNFDDLEFEKIFFLEKFDINKLSKEIQSVFISTLALLQEDSIIQDTISKHEMIHKDEVKSINDIGKKSIGILSGADDWFDRLYPVVILGVIQDCGVNIPFAFFRLHRAAQQGAGCRR